MKRLRPGQIPDWRPGAVFWKPLADGREVTVYPLAYGEARLCVGPLADPQGYDTAYRYKTVADAQMAAEEWDSDAEEHPPDYERIDFGEQKLHTLKAHPAPIHSEGIQAGQKIELNSTLKSHFDIEEVRELGSEKRAYRLEGWSEDGKLMSIEAERSPGDPMGNTGDPLLAVTKVLVRDDN